MAPQATWYVLRRLGLVARCDEPATKIVVVEVVVANLDCRQVLHVTRGARVQLEPEAVPCKGHMFESDQRPAQCVQGMLPTLITESHPSDRIPCEFAATLLRHMFFGVAVQNEAWIIFVVKISF